MWGEAMYLLNKRTRSLLVCLLLAISALSGCSASSGAPAVKASAVYADEKLIDEENMIAEIRELTSDKYTGRMAGTEGNEAAANYIADRFKTIGLSNPKGLENYMQWYPQTVITLKAAPELSIDDAGGESVKEFNYVENFVLRSLSSKGDNIDITAPLYVVEDLGQLTADNKEVQGKLLLISWRLRSSVPFFRLVELVGSCGAAGALGEYDIEGPYRTHGALTVTPMLGPWLMGEHCPFINVDNDTYAELIAAFSSDRQVSFRCSFSREDGKPVPNVVGVLPGADEKLKDKYIIIGAHFDHVGQNLDGSFNPGGLDNGSGIAVMLEIARVIRASNVTPGRSILFLAFNGEEGGMIGSDYYAGHPVYPMDDSVMICLDMVGSSEKLPLMITAAEGSDLALQKEIYGYCKELGIDAGKLVSSGSDHASFAVRGVKSVLLINEDFFNGYHTPEDTIEDVDKSRMEEIVKLVLHYIDKNSY